MCVDWGDSERFLIPVGGSFGGVNVPLHETRSGSHQVTVDERRMAAFEPSCEPLWFRPGIESDTRRFLDTAVRE